MRMHLRWSLCTLHFLYILQARLQPIHVFVVLLIDIFQARINTLCLSILDKSSRSCSVLIISKRHFQEHSRADQYSLPILLQGCKWTVKNPVAQDHFHRGGGQNQNERYDTRNNHKHYLRAPPRFWFYFFLYFSSDMSTQFNLLNFQIQSSP